LSAKNDSADTQEGDSSNDMQSSVDSHSSDSVQPPPPQLLPLPPQPRAFFRTIPPLGHAYIKTDGGLAQAGCAGRFVEVIVRDKVLKIAAYWRVPFSAIDRDDWSVLRSALKSSVPADSLPSTTPTYDFDGGRQACLYRLFGWSGDARTKKLAKGVVDEGDVGESVRAKWTRTPWEQAGPPTTRTAAASDPSPPAYVDGDNDDDDDHLTADQRRERMRQEDDAAARVQLLHNPLWYMRVVLRIDEYDQALHAHFRASILDRPLTDTRKRENNPFEVEDGFVDHSSSCHSMRRLVTENKRLNRYLRELLAAQAEHDKQVREIEAERRKERERALHVYGRIPMYM
jgi:hypothetical protein